MTSCVYLDTSALAKWYLNEPRSDEFEAYVQSVGVPLLTISSLTVVETRSLLARHRRMGHIDRDGEHLVFARFQQDIAERVLSVLPLEDGHALAAAHLLDRLIDHPLRTLDAMHLAICESGGLAELATADAVLAEAAVALGIAVTRFD